MSRRALVTLLAAVIAVAVAIPALADSGTTAKTASVRGLSTRALAKAKAALRIGRAAKREVHKAVTEAGVAQTAATAAGAAAAAAKTSAAESAKSLEGAQERAGGARLKAEEAQKEVASIRPKIGFAENSVSTESTSFAALAGGPSVTVTVNPSGLVQVWAQATVEEEGAVSLYEDGAQVPEQAECAATGAGEGGLFSSPSTEALTIGTPASGAFCGTFGAPAPVLFETTNGLHTFELRYAACGCEESHVPVKAAFSHRRLIVQPMP